MASLKIAITATLLSITSLTPVFAQFSEPAAFQAQHPDRDVLNGGALTPAAGLAAGLDGARSSHEALGSSLSASEISLAPRLRTQHRRRP